VIHPEDRLRVNFDKSNLERGATLYAEYRIIKADDTVCWVGTKVIPSLNAEGRLIRLDGVTSEITRRRKAEDELKMKCHDLSTLIYKLAHDIRGPVVTTAGLINLSKQDVKDATALKYVDMIAQSNNRLDGVVKGLMQLIKIDATIIQKKRIDIARLINSVIESFLENPELKALDFRVKNDVTGNFYCEEELVHIIIYNVIANAVQYRKYLDPFVFIHVFEKDGMLNLLIQDNGMGIGRKHIPRVFDIFFRASEHTKGTGLGLYVVKNIVEKLGGTIELESELREGTSVYISLPLN
jgi:signal transduction histidine kinase